MITLMMYVIGLFCLVHISYAGNNETRGVRLSHEEEVLPLRAPMSVRSYIKRFVDIPFKFNPLEKGSMFLFKSILLHHNGQYIAFSNRIDPDAKFHFYNQSHHFTGRLTSFSPLTLRIQDLTINDNTKLHGILTYEKIISITEKKLHMLRFTIEIRVDGGPFACGKTISQYNITNKVSSIEERSQVYIEMCGNPRPEVTFMYKNKALDIQYIQYVNGHKYRYLAYLPDDMKSDDCGSFIDYKVKSVGRLTGKIRLELDYPPSVQKIEARRNGTCIDVKWKDISSGNCSKEVTYKIFFYAHDGNVILSTTQLKGYDKNIFTTCKMNHKIAKVNIVSTMDNKKSLGSELVSVLSSEEKVEEEKDIADIPILCGEHPLKPVYVYKTWSWNYHLKVSICQNFTHNALSVIFEGKELVVEKERKYNKNEYVYTIKFSEIRTTKCGKILEIIFRNSRNETILRKPSIVHILYTDWKYEKHNACDTIRFHRCFKSQWINPHLNCPKDFVTIKYYHNSNRPPGCWQNAGWSTHMVPTMWNYYVPCFDTCRVPNSVTLGRVRSTSFCYYSSDRVQDLDQNAYAYNYNYWTVPKKVTGQVNGNVTINFVLDLPHNFKLDYLYVEHVQTSSQIASGSKNFFVNNYNSSIFENRLQGSYNSNTSVSSLTINNLKYGDGESLFHIYLVFGYDHLRPRWKRMMRTLELSVKGPVVLCADEDNISWKQSYTFLEGKLARMEFTVCSGDPPELSFVFDKQVFHSITCQSFGARTNKYRCLLEISNAISTSVCGKELHLHSTDSNTSIGTTIINVDFRSKVWNLHSQLVTKNCILTSWNPMDAGNCTRDISYELSYFTNPSQMLDKNPVTKFETTRNNMRYCTTSNSTTNATEIHWITLRIIYKNITFKVLSVFAHGKSSSDNENDDELIAGLVGGIGGCLLLITAVILLYRRFHQRNDN